MRIDLAIAPRLLESYPTVWNNISRHQLVYIGIGAGAFVAFCVLGVLACRKREPQLPSSSLGSASNHPLVSESAPSSHDTGSLTPPKDDDHSDPLLRSKKISLADFPNKPHQPLFDTHKFRVRNEARRPPTRRHR